MFFRHALGIKKEIFEITFQDILLLIKNYKLEDLQFLECRGLTL